MPIRRSSRASVTRVRRRFASTPTGGPTSASATASAAGRRPRSSPRTARFSAAAPIVEREPARRRAAARRRRVCAGPARSGPAARATRRAGRAPSCRRCRWRSWSTQVVATFDPTTRRLRRQRRSSRTSPRCGSRSTLYRRRRSTRHRDIAVTTLDAMGWGPLHDEQQRRLLPLFARTPTGAIRSRRSCSTSTRRCSRSTSTPLEIAAARALRRACRGRPALRPDLARRSGGRRMGRFAARRSRVLRGVRCRQATRRARGAAVDRTLYTDWNALMASAALQAGRVLDDPSLSRVRDHVARTRRCCSCYQPGAGVAHYVDDGAPQVRGLLDDQIAMAAAQLDAFEATGNVVYEMMAEELALHATRTMWDGDGRRLLRPRRRSAAATSGCCSERLQAVRGQLRGGPACCAALARTVSEPRLSRAAPRGRSPPSARRAAGEGPLAAELRPRRQAPPAQ